jgi:hypothetical protein
MTASSTPEWLATHSSRARSRTELGTANAASGTMSGSGAELGGHGLEHGDLAAVDHVWQPGIYLLHGVQGGDVGDRGPALDHRGPQHVAVEREPDRVDGGAVHGVAACRRQSLVEAGGPPLPQRVGFAACWPRPWTKTRLRIGGSLGVLRPVDADAARFPRGEGPFPVGCPPANGVSQRWMLTSGP